MYMLFNVGFVGMTSDMLLIAVFRVFQEGKTVVLISIHEKPSTIQTLICMIVSDVVSTILIFALVDQVVANICSTIHRQSPPFVLELLKLLRSYLELERIT